MALLHIFADEAGDFDFRRGPKTSQYFILCTITMEKCNIANAILRLRRKLAWHGYELHDYFHATTEKQIVRDLVFEVMTRHDFQVQATIMEKSKAQPHVRSSKARFYQYGWLYHFKHGIPEIAQPFDEIAITAAALGIKKERASFLGAVNDVMRQTMHNKTAVANVFPASTDPCLQVADYCAWAIQHKWERNDERSYVYIQDRITYEYDLWARGDTHYY